MGSPATLNRPNVDRSPALTTADAGTPMRNERGAYPRIVAGEERRSLAVNLAAAANLGADSQIAAGERERAIGEIEAGCAKRGSAQRRPRHYARVLVQKDGDRDVRSDQHSVVGDDDARALDVPEQPRDISGEPQGALGRDRPSSIKIHVDDAGLARSRLLQQPKVHKLRRARVRQSRPVGERPCRARQVAHHHGVVDRGVEGEHAAVLGEGLRRSRNRWSRPRSGRRQSSSARARVSALPPRPRRPGAGHRQEERAAQVPKIETARRRQKYLRNRLCSRRW